MSKIFKQWQNKEIFDIDCIRNLNKLNDEMLGCLIEIYGVSLYSEDRGLLPIGKIKNIIESTTGLSIEEVING